MNRHENINHRNADFPRDRTGAPVTAAFTTADDIENLIEEMIALTDAGTAELHHWIHPDTFITAYLALDAAERTRASDVIRRHVERLEMRADAHSGEDRALTEAITPIVPALHTDAAAMFAMNYVPPAKPAAPAAPFNCLNYPRNRTGAPLTDEFSSPRELDSLLEEMTALGDEGTAYLHPWVHADTLAAVYRALPEYARQDAHVHLMRHLEKLAGRTGEDLTSGRALRDMIRTALDALAVERVLDLNQFRVDLAFTEIVRRSLGETLPRPVQPPR